MAAPRLTDEQKKVLAYVAAQRDFRTYLSDWLDKELAALPYALGNTATVQGRCQVLMELEKLMSDTLTHTG